MEKDLKNCCFELSKPCKPCITPSVPYKVPSYCICDYDRLCQIIQSITVAEHTPCMVCCTAIRVWALFLMEIEHNIETWQKWITKVFDEIQQMKRLGAVKWEWIYFLRTLKEDISKWLSYKEHLDDVAIKTADYFQCKHVECCPLCLKDYIHYENLGAEHLCPELIEAMDAAPYWRQLLDEMVIDCEFKKLHGKNTGTIIGMELKQEPKCLCIDAFD